MQNLPAELKATPLAQRTRVLDRHGNPIATFYDENRVNVTLDKVAPIMKRAIIAIEDYRFYEHGALDIKGTLRAFVNNQTSSGSGTQGGSSITQQMAKMTQLAQARTEAERKAATENTYQRKIQELRHAIAFEQNYSKDWILERYLNLAYFGDGAYGVQAAARHYYSVNASQLNTIQSATLAGLVKNPVGFDPTTFPERAIARRNVVVNRMAELGVIRDVAAQSMVKQPLRLKVSKARNGCLGTKAAFFCDYVRRYLMADPALGRTLADRQQLLNSGGLTIKTTVDLDFSRAAEDAATTAVGKTDEAIGALAMVQPGTGDVMAIAQSRPMGRERKDGETFLNYVVDSKYGDSGGFQAGSTFKIFVLAAALEQGLPTSTAFVSPVEMNIPSNTFPDCEGNYASSEVHTWHNSTTKGSPKFDMTKGTRLSVNTYFAQLERKTGLCEPYALAKAMGVDLTDPDHERVPTFTLGVASVSPLEMASAYATVAARGKHCDARPVTQILNSDGKVFKNYPKDCQQVIQESSADTINAILRGLMQPGGFGSALALDKPSAGKTGTINSNMAVWFNGYTPSAGDRRDGRGRQLERTADHAERQDGRRAHHRRGVRLHGGGADVGPGHACRPGQAALRGLHAVLRHDDDRRAGRDPRRHRDVDAPGRGEAGRCRLLRHDRRPPAVQRARGQRRRERAGRRSVRSARLDGHAVPVVGLILRNHRARVVRRPRPRHRRPGPWSSG